MNCANGTKMPILLRWRWLLQKQRQWRSPWLLQLPLPQLPPQQLQLQLQPPLLCSSVSGSSRRTHRNALAVDARGNHLLTLRSRRRRTG